jgi:hypothetical protein
MGRMDGIDRERVGEKRNAADDQRDSRDDGDERGLLVALHQQPDHDARKYEGDRRALGQRGRRQSLGQERHSKEEIVQTEWQATQELDDRRGRERERRH